MNILTYASLLYLVPGFPWWLNSKESACQCKRHRFNPWLGRSPEEGNGNPVQYSCLGNPMDRGAWWVCSPWGCKELHVTERLSTHTCAHTAQPIEEVKGYGYLKVLDWLWGTPLSWRSVHLQSHRYIWVPSSHCCSEVHFFKIPGSATLVVRQEANRESLLNSYLWFQFVSAFAFPKLEATLGGHQACNS